MCAAPKARPCMSCARSRKRAPGGEAAGARDEGGRRRRRRRRGTRREALEPGLIAPAPAEAGSGQPREAQHIEGVPEHSEALASPDDEEPAPSAEKATSEEGA